MRNALLLLLLTLTGQGQQPDATPPAASVRNATPELLPEMLVGAWQGQWVPREGGPGGPAEIVFSRGHRPGTVVMHVTLAGRAAPGTIRRQGRLDDGIVRVGLADGGLLALRLATADRLTGSWTLVAGPERALELSRLRR